MELQSSRKITAHAGFLGTIYLYTGSKCVKVKLFHENDKRQFYNKKTTHTTYEPQLFHSTFLHQ